LLHRPQRQRQFRGDDREQKMSARQAAEALFTPKPDVIEQPVSDPSQSAKARKPRVLPILPPAPILSANGRCACDTGASDGT
jgi:hypothetical protein